MKLIHPFVMTTTWKLSRQSWHKYKGRIMYKPTDRIIFTGTDANNLLEFNNSGNPDKHMCTKLALNERLYLQKIVTLKKELEHERKTKLEIARQLRVSNVSLDAMEGQFTRMCKQVEQIRSINYQQGN